MLGELTDEEFDEIRLIITRARNGHQVDRERFRFLMDKLRNDAEREGLHDEGFVQKIRGRLSKVRTG